MGSEEINIECYASDDSYKEVSVCCCVYCIEGVVIAAQCTATVFKIYCAALNLGITRT